MVAIRCMFIPGILHYRHRLGRVYWTSRLISSLRGEGDSFVVVLWVNVIGGMVVIDYLYSRNHCSC